MMVASNNRQKTVVSLETQKAEQNETVRLLNDLNKPRRSPQHLIGLHN